MPNLLHLLDWLLTKQDGACACIRKTWILDPLQHPDIARMDQRELGDLPFAVPCTPSKNAAG